MKPNLEMQINETQLNTTKVGLYIVTYGYLKDPSDVQEAAFAYNHLGIISPPQKVFAQIKGDGGIFNRFSITNAEVFYDDRNNQVVIVPNGMISKLVGIGNLVDAHLQGKVSFIPENKKDSVYDVVDKMKKEDTAFTANHGQTRVSTLELGQTKLTSKLFSYEGLEIKAQDYGDWLKYPKIRSVYLSSSSSSFNSIDCLSLSFDSMEYAKSQKSPYWTKLRLLGRSHKFGVEGYSGSLDRKRGAFLVSFEKTTAKAIRKNYKDH